MSQLFYAWDDILSIHPLFSNHIETGKVQLCSTKTLQLMVQIYWPMLHLFGVSMYYKLVVLLHVLLLLYTKI